MNFLELEELSYKKGFKPLLNLYNDLELGKASEVVVEEELIMLIKEKVNWNHCNFSTMNNKPNQKFICMVIFL